jgi:hypothetical protein
VYTHPKADVVTVPAQGLGFRVYFVVALGA